MKAGQKVRVKPTSRFKDMLDISPDAQGTILCSYRLLREGWVAPERLDVRFGPRLVVWGAPEVEFEIVPSGS